MLGLSATDLTLMALFATLAISLNLVCGIGRHLVFSQAASYGVGAYTAAIFTTHWSVGFWVCLAAAAASGALAGAILGLPVLRTTGAYFAMLTWGVASIAQDLANNLEITGGPSGLGPLAPPKVFGTPLVEPGAFSRIAWLLSALTLLIVVAVARSRTGWAMALLGSDVPAAQSLGMSRRAVLVGFMISSALASVAGGVFAYFIAVVYPGSFGIDFSTLLIIALLVGGLGSVTGSLVGAIAVAWLQSALQSYPEMADIIFGAALVVIVHLRPQGLISQSGEKRATSWFWARFRTRHHTEITVAEETS